MRNGIEMQMRWLMAVTYCSCLFLLAGCSDPQRSRLVGSWQLQKPEQISKRFANSDAPSADNSSESSFDNRMLIEFRRNGTLRTVTRIGNIDREKTGTWELLQFDEPDNRAMIRCEINSQTTEHEVEWLDSGALKMVPPNMAGTTTRLTFVRAN